MMLALHRTEQRVRPQNEPEEFGFHLLIVSPKRLKRPLPPGTL